MSKMTNRRVIIHNIHDIINENRGLGIMGDLGIMRQINIPTFDKWEIKLTSRKSDYSGLLRRPTNIYR